MASRLRALLVCLAGVLALTVGPALAQGRGGQAAPAAPPINPSDDPVLKTFKWRSIGPASMGGRIDDIEAVESNPSIIYAGYATGGVWKTTNMGTTWEPIFDEPPVSSIGAIAIAPTDPNVVWVGTGENNNQRSVGYGDGYPRSLSNKAFCLIGGKRARIIGRICMDQMLADVTNIRDVKTGQEAVLIGRQKAEAISAEELAKLAGTIPYEIVCNLGQRIPRVYRKG